MLFFFRGNQFYLLFPLALLAILLRLPSYADQAASLPASPQGWLALPVLHWAQDHPFPSAILTTTLLLVQATLIVLIVRNQRLMREFNLFPGVMLVLFSSLLPDLMPLSPVLLANTCLLVALDSILRIHQKTGVPALLFNAGFWTSVASLFCGPYVFFHLAGLMALNVVRGWKNREFLQYLGGWLLPWILAATWAFWEGRYWEYLRHTYAQYAFFHWVGPTGLPQWSALGLYLLAILTALISLNIYQSRKENRVQKQISILYWFLFSGFLVAASAAGADWTLISVCLVPLSIFLSMNFSAWPVLVAEGIHVLLLAAIVYFQYFHSHTIS